MRIISGTHKSRRIPFSNKDFGNARVTSDFVKEAVFGSLGPDLTGRRFLDVFSGSGQMGLEALSRGGIVWMNERDRKRHSFIQNLLTTWDIGEDATLTNLDWRRLASQFSPDTAFDLAYVDPPYASLSEETVPESVECLQWLDAGDVIVQAGWVYVQHARRVALPERVGKFERIRQKRYGDSMLSRYQRT